MSTNSIGDRVNSLRAKKRLTQSKLAESLGVHASAISQIESGKNGLSADLAYKIARYFNTTVEWILTGEDSSFIIKNEYNDKKTEKSQIIINDSDKWKEKYYAQLEENNKLIKELLRKESIQK